MKYLIYVTKDKKNVLYDDLDAKWLGVPSYDVYTHSFRFNKLNGKICAELECDKVEEILIKPNGNYYTNTLSNNELLAQSCLTQKEMFDYLSGNWHKKYNYWFGGYAIHIKNLHIFDRPLELNEVEVDNHNANPYLDSPFKPLTKAPQNMMRVWYNGEQYILISIRPEWACKILNGEKTIEIRKQVLKEMK